MAVERSDVLSLSKYRNYNGNINY